MKGRLEPLMSPLLVSAGPSEAVAALTFLLDLREPPGEAGSLVGRPAEPRQHCDRSLQDA